MSGYCFMLGGVGDCNLHYILNSIVNVNTTRVSWVQDKAWGCGPAMQCRNSAIFETKYCNWCIQHKDFNFLSDSACPQLKSGWKKMLELLSVSTVAAVAPSAVSSGGSSLSILLQIPNLMLTLWHLCISSTPPEGVCQYMHKLKAED